MGVHLELLSHDDLFQNLDTPPVILNGYDISLQVDKDRLNKLIYTKYEGDSLDVLPSCDCGRLRGEQFVNLRCKRGVLPDDEEGCNTLCVSVTERPLESLLWIAPPKGVSALINPIAWVILSKKFTFDGCNLLEWLCNPYYKVDRNPPPKAIAKLKTLGLERGLNYFHANFDLVIGLLFDNNLVQGSARERKALRIWIMDNRRAIFSQHLPIPSKLAFIMEDTPTGIYADHSMLPAIQAIRTICEVENSLDPVSLKLRQSRAILAINQLGDYYKAFFGKQLGGKPGWFRKHVFGSRLHFSFRAVISSITDNHEYDELHLPWSMSVMVMKAYLSSKLLHRGFTPNETIQFLYEHTNKYHPLLDELFQELIREGHGGSLSCILQRNPTLTRLSAQLLRITRVKTDVDDNTIGLGALVLPGLNESSFLLIVISVE